MVAQEIKGIIRQMLADWDALTEQGREDALRDALAELVDRRRQSHEEPIK